MIKRTIVVIPHSVVPKTAYLNLVDKIEYPAWPKWIRNPIQWGFENKDDVLKVLDTNTNELRSTSTNVHDTVLKPTKIYNWGTDPTLVSAEELHVTVDPITGNIYTWYIGLTTETRTLDY